MQNKKTAFYKTIGTLTLLFLLLPFNFIIVVLALVFSWSSSLFRKKTVAEHPNNILITGAKMTKCLQLARLFHGAGHRVFLLETHKYWLSGYRFSRAVTGFYTVPEPQMNAEGYCQGILNIIKREKIDVFIPVSSPIASYYDSLAKKLIAPLCECILFEPEITLQLDNKFTFTETVHKLGLSGLKSHLITDPQQILNFDFAGDGSQYIVKSIAYDSCHRLDLTRLPLASTKEMEAFLEKLPISPENPWVMQEFIEGKEYCTHSTVKNRSIRLHRCSHSSPFQVNYQQVDNPAIFQWIQQFVKALNLTGQISFDFIQTQDGTVYPIEFNPRTHSAITMFYNHPEAADAYLENNPDKNKMPVEPLPGSKPTYWLYHELWQLTKIRSWRQCKQWGGRLIEGKDAIFQLDDPLPFLMVPHWQITLLLLKNLRRLKNWIKIDFNIGKLVEPDGD